MSKSLDNWVLNDVDALTRGMNREIQKALRIHKLLGNPIYVAGENGEVLEVQPEDIQLNEELLAEADGEATQ